MTIFKFLLYQMNGGPKQKWNNDLATIFHNHLIDIDYKIFTDKNRNMILYINLNSDELKDVYDILSSLPIPCDFEYSSYYH